jgi:hypothetical protein
LTKWKDYLDIVITSINNHNKKIYKSLQNQLLAYFTQDQQIIPQLNLNLYKYKINDQVGLDVFPRQRRNLGFKYTLNLGEKRKYFKNFKL